MKKRILSIMMVVMMVITMLPSTAFASDTITYDANGSATISSEVTINTDYEIASGQTLTVASGGTLTVNGTLTVASGGTLNVNGGTVTATSSDSHGIYVIYGTLNVNDGTVEATGTKGYGIYVSKSEVTISGGTVKAYGAETLGVNDIQVSNNNTSATTTSSTLTIEGGTVEADVIGNSGSTITIEGGTVNASTIINESADATLTIEEGATLTITNIGIFTNAGTITNNGTIELPTGTTTEEIAALNITGTGTIVVDGVIYGNNGVAIKTSSSSKSYYIKATATGNGTVAPEDEDVSPDSMYKVDKLSDVTFEFTPDSGYEVVDVIVNGKSVGTCDEYEFEDIIITMQTIEVVFEKKSGSSSDDDEDDDVDEEEEIDEDVVEIELPFTDIDEDNDNLDGIEYVYENGIMAGISADEFGGDMSITRGMIAAILYRMGGSEAVEGDMPFGDVPADQYYYNAVLWGKANGVMAGVSAEEFDPDAPITNEQFIVFLYRYANFLGMDMSVEFDMDMSDYEMSDYAIIAIAWALENGIIDEDFDPMATAIRGDVATGLMNFMEMM